MILHFHRYKLVEDLLDFDWGGVTVRRRVWKCRYCKARKVRMSGTMTP